MKVVIAFSLLIAIATCSAEASGAQDVEIRLDLNNRLPVSKSLYGIFFEEINHAGEGGLYNELVQDRSFDALAATSGFVEDQDFMELSKIHFEAPEQQNSTEIKEMGDNDTNSASLNGKHRFWAVNGLFQPVSWRPSDSARTALTREKPLHPYNKVALRLTTTVPYTGIANTGYWGMPLNGGWVYRFSMYVRGDKGAKVQVLFRSQDQTRVYAEVVFDGINEHWQKVSSDITSDTTDFKGEVVVQLVEPGTVTIDSLSLFPGGNIKKGWQNPYPFRMDLLQHLKDLNPRFLRFPGGCYVEGGDFVKNRFPWKTNLGLDEHRSGHLNDNWGYWSTDGLGLFEYMVLAEELKAEPIYVVNNGISHTESKSGVELTPFLEETLQALEFIHALANSSRWAAIRASMGRVHPWKLNYLAIGNEDCVRPKYVENYKAFYIAVKKLYPHLTLIANCDLTKDAPTELWDWHSYDTPEGMFANRHYFDEIKRAKIGPFLWDGGVPPIFVSEYAVTTGGGKGNVKGAVAEAGFMTGLERNSDLIKLASYAPLFVHTENRAWATDLIVFDNHRSFKTPSYLVQQLFSRFQGEDSVRTDVVPRKGAGHKHDTLVASSATCQNSGCDKLAIKASHFSPSAQNVTITIASQKQAIILEEEATLYYVTGDADAENTFDDPNLITLRERSVNVSGSKLGGYHTFQIELPAWSASALELTLKPKPS